MNVGMWIKYGIMEADAYFVIKKKWNVKSEEICKPYNN